MKSNFESKNHKKDFFNFLREGAVPLKYAYSGSGTFKHNKLASRGSYHHAVTGKLGQYSYIEKRFKSERVNLIEIGSGNGISSVNLITTLKKSGINIAKYVGIDFSKNLMNICKKRIDEFFPELPPSFYQSDIEIEIKNNIKKVFSKSDKTNLVFMIGNTLGNVENPIKTLSNIESILKVGDYFVIGVSLLKDDQNYDYVKDYLNKVFYDACIEPFKMAGMWNKTDKLEIIFDKDIPAILGLYYPSKDLLIKEGNDKFIIKANSKIRCFMSRRFTIDGLNNLLTQAGLEVVNNKASEDSNVLVTTSVKK